MDPLGLGARAAAVELAALREEERQWRERVDGAVRRQRRSRPERDG